MTLAAIDSLVRGSTRLQQAIPTDTPASGIIRVKDNDGYYRRITYASYTGSTFTIAASTPVTEDDFCGDPACAGGFTFINNTPAKNKLDYIQLWQKFAELFEKWGYTPIKRYPVVARWRKDTEFVQASIYDFQPYLWP